MGFFDSFKSGAKDVFKGYDKVKLNDKITYDELYEIMKDETYSVGKPQKRLQFQKYTAVQAVWRKR